jgi:uncharacterized membrane-anchored protein
MREIRGTARLDRRTKRLAKRLRRGEIAIIDHEDVDALAAASLAECRAAAVVNVQETMTGKFPNAGPQVLLDSRIPVLDCVGADLFDLLREGDEIAIRGGQVWRDSTLLASGDLLTEPRYAELSALAAKNVESQLEGFVQNTLSFLSAERDLLFNSPESPRLKTQILDRHVLVVVRGEGYREDLRAISSYLTNKRPVVIAVDGGADAVLEMGIKPDLIVGDMDSVSDRALRSCGEVVVHAYPESDFDPPGLARVRACGISDPHIFASPGTSEDIALLLAYENGADVIITVGTHQGLVEFLSKGRKGMASTFLVRTRLAHKLVDAKGVSKLYPSGLSWRYVGVLVLVGLLVVSLVVSYSPDLGRYLRLVLDSVF